MQDSPIFGAPPAEVPLPRSPLAHVIAQVRFPLVAGINRQAFIVDFQERIRAEYPVLQEELTLTLRVDAGAESNRDAQTHWRFTSPDHPWSVVLAPAWLALETRQYTRRADLLERLGRLLEALEATIQPRQLTRLGVRYIDQILGEPLARVDQLFRPELIGSLTGGLRGELVHSYQDLLTRLPEEDASLRLRWAWLPAGAVLDAQTLSPVNQPSCVLDVDAFRAGEPRPFDPHAIAQEARALCERIYAMFRWAVTDEFLREFGGQP